MMMMIATYYRPKELLNQRPEVFSICRPRKKIGGLVYKRNDKNCLM